MVALFPSKAAGQLCAVGYTKAVTDMSPYMVALSTGAAFVRASVSPASPAALSSVPVPIPSVIAACRYSAFPSSEASPSRAMTLTAGRVSAGRVSAVVLALFVCAACSVCPSCLKSTANPILPSVEGFSSRSSVQPVGIIVNSNAAAPATSISVQYFFLMSFSN